MYGQSKPSLSLMLASPLSWCIYRRTAAVNSPRSFPWGLTLCMFSVGAVCLEFRRPLDRIKSKIQCCYWFQNPERNFCLRALGCRQHLPSSFLWSHLESSPVPCSSLKAPQQGASALRSSPTGLPSDGWQVSCLCLLLAECLLVSPLRESHHSPFLVLKLLAGKYTSLPVEVLFLSKLKHNYVRLKKVSVPTLPLPTSDFGSSVLVLSIIFLSWCI